MNVRYQVLMDSFVTKNLIMNSMFHILPQGEAGNFIKIKIIKVDILKYQIDLELV